MIIKQLLWALVKLVCASILAQCLAHTCPIDGMCSYVIFVPQTTAQGGYHYSSFTQGLSDFPRTVETVVGRKEYLQVKVKAIHSVVSDSLRPHGLYGPWNSPGQNTGVGSLSLPQGTFPTYKSNWGLLHWNLILYQLKYQGSRKECLPYRCAVQNLGLHFFHCMASHTTEHAAWSDNSEEMGTRQCKEMSPVGGWPPLSVFPSHWDTQRRLCYGGNEVSAPLVSSSHVPRTSINLPFLCLSYFGEYCILKGGEGHSQGRVSYRWVHSLLTPLGLWSGEIWDWTSIFLKGLLAGNVKKSLFSSCYTKDKEKNRAKHNTLTDPLVMKMKSQNLASKWRNSRQSVTK